MFYDFSAVKGQEHVKRALEVAVAGGHSMLLVGPPGAGKTMLAQAAATILPAPDAREGVLGSGLGGIWKMPPHTITAEALFHGNGKPPLAALAHGGLLVLDDVTGFAPLVLDALKMVLDQGQAGGYPARFTLIVTTNPCPCGHYSDRGTACTCTPRLVAQYQQRIPAPLRDRIAIHMEVPQVDYDKLVDGRPGEPSAAVQARVARARAIQRERFAGSAWQVNADLGPAEVRAYCVLDTTSQHLLQAAVTQLQLSARVYDQVLRLARTSADLAGSAQIGCAHVAEAIQYQPRRGA